MEEFEEFWAAYPRKTSKGDARRAWNQTASIRPSLPLLLAAVERGKQSVQWHKADREGNVGAFIPYPASYLRQEGWDNEYTVQLNAIRTHAAHVAPTVVKPTQESIDIARKAMSGLKRVA